MTVELHLGDCLSVMAELPENSVDTIITDPPYGLTFMGKDWDRGVPGVAFWREALRVAKPGATLLAMGGTRTFHRLVCAIEDAGWEVRDSMAWLYGSGFPKSYDISKGIDKQAGAQREVVGKRTGAVNPNGYKTDGIVQSGGAFAIGEFNITAPSTPEAQLWDGWGTALKPAMELICVAMKPIDGTFVNNALTWGVAGLWIDGGRVGYEEGGDAASNPLYRKNNGYKTGYGIDSNPTSFALKDDKGEMNINPQGRFPANVIHDGSDEVTGLFPQTTSGNLNSGHKRGDGTGNSFMGGGGVVQGNYGGDSGSAARFFYCAKASRSERNAGLDEQTNGHPTVKPLALMRYLARLTKTPTGGVVLDPFMGSGTTGCAAVLEGRDFIGIELNAEYLEIAEKRIADAQKQLRLI